VPLAVLGTTAVAIALAAWLPWNSLFAPPDLLGTTRIEAFTIQHGLWLLAAGVALRFHVGRGMWLLLAAYPLVDSITWNLQFVPNNVAFWTGLTFISLGTAVFVHALVAFPVGRLINRGDRLLVGFVYAFSFVFPLVDAMLSDRYYEHPFWNPNPYFVTSNEVLHDVTSTIAAIGVPIIGVGVIWAVVRHWREAGPVGRRFLGPALVALPFVYVTDVVTYVGDTLDNQWMSDLGRHPILLALNMIVPVGLLVGMLRARLRRGGVADLVLELGQGIPLGALRDRIAGAIGDPTLQLAFPSPGGGFVDSTGQPFELPSVELRRNLARLDRDGETLAVLVHDPAIDEESPGLVAAVGSAARLALENERLAAEVRAQLEEVRASRARLARAADNERRRVERDLHDGAQQRLVALTMRLEQARSSTEGSAALIDEATRELREAIAEVRSLARGMHPPILTEAGLAAAVESLAERTPIPVEVDIPEQRLPEPIEAAAYFVVAEALTNAARHAQASVVRIVATVTADHATVTISDDGRGGAAEANGSGLRGLGDRVAAVGGSLEVISPAGGGTTITATLPLS
jgi:signal transduction histidine kinase